jgi:regulator of replication initiation timing
MEKELAKWIQLGQDASRIMDKATAMIKELRLENHNLRVENQQLRAKITELEADPTGVIGAHVINAAFGGGPDAPSLEGVDVIRLT